MPLRLNKHVHCHSTSHETCTFYISLQSYRLFFFLVHWQIAATICIHITAPCSQKRTSRHPCSCPVRSFLLVKQGPTHQEISQQHHWWSKTPQSTFKVNMTLTSLHFNIFYLVTARFSFILIVLFI